MTAKKKYAVEVKRDEVMRCWRWEVWVATDMVMVSEGWAKSKALAAQLGAACRWRYEELS